MAKHFSGWKKKYSYLDDYKKGLDGTYVYYGRHHVFQGSPEELRRYKWILGITDLLAAALFIGSGIMDGGAIWSTWYVVIPFALEVVTIFLLVWKTITLLFEKNPVKSYIYKKTVPWFQPLSVLLMVFAGLSVLLTGLCMILKSSFVKPTGCIYYMILQLAMAVLAFVFFRWIKRSAWEEDPSEEME